MNRGNLQELAKIRIREARALLTAGEHSGAYYLAGYAIELALKACIAKKTKRHDFPDKKIANDVFTHNLERLVMLADLGSALKIRLDASEEFRKNWQWATEWSESSRYQIHDEKASKALVDAIIGKRHGVMPWITQHW